MKVIVVVSRGVSYTNVQAFIDDDAISGHGKRAALRYAADEMRQHRGCHCHVAHGEINANQIVQLSSVVQFEISRLEEAKRNSDVC